MPNALNQEFCEPCSLGTPPLEGKDLDDLILEIDPKWQVENASTLVRSYKFNNFKEALDFVNHIGSLAESQGHHPDIELGWGKVVVRLTTHKIHGLSRNDFIFAAKLDQLMI